MPRLVTILFASWLLVHPAVAAVASGPDLGEAALRELLTKVNRSHDVRTFEEGITTLERRFPRYRRLQLVHARYLTEKRRWPEAHRHYQVFLSQSGQPEPSPSIRRVAECVAALTLARGAEERAKEGQLWSLLAQAELAERNLAQANHFALQAAELLPDSPEPLVLAAVALARGDQIADAVDLLGRALERAQPAQRPLLRDRLARLQRLRLQAELERAATQSHITGAHREAGYRYQEAWENAPERGALGVQALMELLLAQELPAARTLYWRLRTASELAEDGGVQARIQQLAGQVSQLAESPSGDRAQRLAQALRAARVALETNKDAQAAASLRTAADLAPDHALVFGLRAQALASAGQISEALTLYDRALAADPDSVLWLLRKGELLATRRRFPEAEKVLAAAVRGNPYSVAARGSLARVLLRLDRAAAAIATLRPVFDIVTGEAWLHQLMGDALAKLGDWAGAEAAYTWAQRNGGWDWELYAALIRSREKQGKDATSLRFQSARIEPEPATTDEPPRVGK